MTKRTPSRPTQAERTVNTGAIEQVALGTTAAAMVLGILAGETHGKTPPPAAAQPHHDTPAQAPGEAFHESDHAGTSGAAVSEPGPSSSSPAASSAATPVWSRPDAQTHQGADAQHADDGGAAAFTAADSGGHAVTESSSHSVGHADAAAIDAGGATTASAAHDAGAAAEAPSALIDVAPLMPDASFVHDTVTGLTDNLPAIVTDATAAITDLTSSLGATIDTAVQSILAVPTAAAGQLVDTVFHQPAAIATPAVDGLIDHTPLVATVAQLSPITLGFMGQPATDDHGAHDGAFSALGLHHF